MALTRYLTREQADSRRWLDLAAVQTALNKKDQAFQSLENAIKVGGPPVQDLARQDARLNNLKTDPRFGQLVPAAPANFSFPMKGF